MCARTQLRIESNATTMIQQHTHCALVLLCTFITVDYAQSIGEQRSERIAHYSAISYRLFLKQVEHGCVDDYMDNADAHMYTPDARSINWLDNMEQVMDEPVPLLHTDAQYWRWERAAFESVLVHRFNENERHKDRPLINTLSVVTNGRHNDRSTEDKLLILCNGPKTIGDFYGTNDSATQMHEDNGSSDSTAEQKVRERSEFQDALHRVVFPNTISIPSAMPKMSGQVPIDTPKEDLR